MIVPSFEENDRSLFCPPNARMRQETDTLLPMDEMLRERAQKLKARREKVLIEIAGARRQSEIPLASLSPRQVDAFGAALHARLTDAASATTKTYLCHLVTEIRFDGKRVVMQEAHPVSLIPVNPLSTDTRTQ